MPDQLLDIGVEPVRQGDQAPEQVGDDPVQRLGAVHDDGIPAACEADLGAVASKETLTGTPVLGVDNRPVSFVGPVDPSTVAVSLAREGDWALAVDGTDVPGQTVLGWAQSYRVVAPGTGELTHSPSTLHLVALLVSVLATVGLALAVTGVLRYRPGLARRGIAPDGAGEGHP